MLLISCQKRYTADEIVEYLPFESPNYYKIYKDTAYGDYWQMFEIVVDREYFNRTKEMIRHHKNFKNLGYIQDSLFSYSRIGDEPEAYFHNGTYYFSENSIGTPRLTDKFLYFDILLEKDSIISIICRPL